MGEFNKSENYMEQPFIEVIPHYSFTEISVNGFDPVTILPRENIILYKTDRNYIHYPVNYFSYLLCSGKKGWSILIANIQEDTKQLTRQSLIPEAEKLGYHPVILNSQHQYLPEIFYVVTKPEDLPMHFSITMGIYVE